jgi:hypothetical protein
MISARANSASAGGSVPLAFSRTPTSASRAGADSSCRAAVLQRGEAELGRRFPPERERHAAPVGHDGRERGGGRDRDHVGSLMLPLHPGVDTLREPVAPDGPPESMSRVARPL